MKKKIIFIPFFLLMLTAIFSFVSLKNPDKGKQDQVELIFTRQMGFNDLVKAKLDMAEEGITLKYKLLKFDDEGRLSGIAFQVNCNDGFSGSASNLFLSYEDGFGFIRDYRPGSESPFLMGKLMEE